MTGAGDDTSALLLAVVAFTAGVGLAALVLGRERPGPPDGPE